MGDNPTGRVRWLLLAVGLFTLLGAGFRFHGLGDRDFWFDESCTFNYVHNLFDWPSDSNLLAESTNLPYYGVLRGWAFLFGDSEASYRSYSALLSTLTIPLLSLTAWRLGGIIAGVICGAIIAFNPLHIHYAHEARAYAMWMFLLSVTFCLLLEAGRRLRWKWWIAYGIALLACLHLHYFTIYWVPATVVGIYLAQDGRRALRQWVFTHVAVGILFIPYFLAAVWPAARGGGSGWVAQTWEPLTAIPRTLWAFLPAGGYPAHLRGLSILSGDTVKLGPEWLTAIVQTIPAVLMVTTVLYLVRRHLRDPGRVVGDSGDHLSREPGRVRTFASRRTGKACGSVGHMAAPSTQRSASDAPDVEQRGFGHVFAAGMTLLPLILAWVYSLLVRPNYVVARYDLVAWPACMVWLALLTGSVGQPGRGRRSVWLAVAICVPLLACSLVPIARMAALRPGPTFANVRARQLAQLAGPQDLAITFSYDRDYLLYYLHRAGFTGRIIAYPSWLNRQVGWVNLEPELTNDMVASLATDAAAFVDDVDAVLARGGRVWLLPDSHEHRVDPQGQHAPWPRAQVNQFLLGALEDAGFQRDVVGGNLLILNVRR